jgi:hypothetical protein
MLLSLTVLQGFNMLVSVHFLQDRSLLGLEQFTLRDSWHQVFELLVICAIIVDLLLLLLQVEGVGLSHHDVRYLNGVDSLVVRLLRDKLD